MWLLRNRVVIRSVSMVTTFHKQKGRGRTQRVIFLFEAHQKNMALFRVASRTVSYRCKYGIWRCDRYSSTAAGVQVLRDVLRNELDDIRTAGTWKTERVILTPQAAAIRVRESAGPVLNFCANNYLGLSVSIDFLIRLDHLSKWLYVCSLIKM